jgi:predicted RNA methylase
METNILSKIFPPVLNSVNLPKYDQEGLWSITYPQDAELISQLIKQEIGKESFIMDATAGVGGNTISFAKHFKYVYSVEICKSRFELLVNNINAYELKNITATNNDCLEIIDGPYNGYFFDPPWGGPNYKYNKETKIKLGNFNLEDVVLKVKNTNDKPIFIKLPFNYDMSEFSNFNYKVDKIKNYQLVTIYQD